MGENEKIDGRGAYYLALVDHVTSKGTKDTIITLGILVVIIMLIGVLAVMMGSIMP